MNDKKLKYHLDKLEWQQFELLAFKCLQLDISPLVHFIEGGKDKGRDFLYEGLFPALGVLEHSKIIFQAKHKTSKKPFQDLKHDLAEELLKVFIINNLKCDFYCLVTNLTISGTEYDELVEAFHATVRDHEITPSPKFIIYSYRQFESCIDRNDTLKWDFPAIVSSADFKILLNNIVNRQEQAVSNGWINVFKKNKELFINTQAFQNAIDKLNNNHIVLLSGPPKSGKTFNAEMIVFSKVCGEGFSAYKIDGIEEFNRYYNPETKQLFLFDDAFGKHNLDLYRADSIDRKLEYIIEQSDLNHKYIFTSREYIYRAFLDYTEKEINDVIQKVNVEVSDLTVGEKESLFRRYFSISYGDGVDHISNIQIRNFANHANFSPETIRAYFENSRNFSVREFEEHLKLPDKYLEKVFANLSKEKRIILLSVLFAIGDNEKTIAYSFDKVCQDLNVVLLISIKQELLQLSGSIIKQNGDSYSFYHPSMSEFFINYLGADLTTYRSLLFKNFNITLLSITRFKPQSHTGHHVKISLDDIPNFEQGVSRLIQNPFITLFEINSLFSWLRTDDVQLNFKLLGKDLFKNLINTIKKALSSINYHRLLNNEIHHIAPFLYHLNQLLGISKADTILPLDACKKLIVEKREDRDYWILVFRLSPFLEENLTYELIGKKWLNEFFTVLKLDIDSLGRELYGTAYPEFEEVKTYNNLIQQKRFSEAQKIEKRSLADFKQSTSSQWYHKYKRVKEKIMVLKSSHPFGYKIYQKLIGRFEYLKMLEDNQKNRYIFNKKLKRWS